MQSCATEQLSHAWTGLRPQCFIYFSLYGVGVALLVDTRFGKGRRIFGEINKIIIYCSTHQFWPFRSNIHCESDSVSAMLQLLSTLLIVKEIPKLYLVQLLDFECCFKILHGKIKNTVFGLTSAKTSNFINTNDPFVAFPKQTSI